MLLSWPKKTYKCKLQNTAVWFSNRSLLLLLIFQLYRKRAAYSYLKLVLMNWRCLARTSTSGLWTGSIKNSNKDWVLVRFELESDGVTWMSASIRRLWFHSQLLLIVMCAFADSTLYATSLSAVVIPLMLVFHDNSLKHDWIAHGYESEYPNDV